MFECPFACCRLGEVRAYSLGRYQWRSRDRRPDGIDAGMDTGDVALQKRTEIGANETAGELHDRLARIGADAPEQTQTARRWPGRI